MSSEDSTVNVAQTDKETTPGEAVLILSLVLGFFLSILVALRMVIRHRKTIKNKLFTKKESIKRCRGKERVSWTASTGPNYFVPKSLTDGSLVLISNRDMRLPGEAERARYMVNPRNSSKYYHYRNSDDRKWLKPQELEWSGMQSDGRSSVIYQPANVLYARYSSTTESTFSASESTDFTSSSMEKMHDFEDYNRMYQVHTMQKQYNHFNYTSELSSVMDPACESQVTPNSVRKIPLSKVDITTDNQGTHNKWMSLGHGGLGSSSASSSDSTSAEVISSNSGIEREMKENRYISAETPNDRESRGTVRINSSITNENSDSADIAFHTPFVESEESVRHEFQWEVDERDIFETHGNDQPRYQNIKIVYGSENRRINTPGFDKEDETTRRGVHNGEVRMKITSGEEYDAATSTCITDDEVSIKRRSQIYHKHRNSVEMSPQ